MSYRELRNFCEYMRVLGYPRIISIENFKKPNFELVAEILYWLAQRFDPKADVPDDIEDEKNRVEFIKAISQLFAVKARVKLNPKKLYSADGYAVQEMLKIASLLFKAYTTPGREDDESSKFTLPSRLANTKDVKTLAGEITEKGAKLYDLLNKEPELKQFREKAIGFLNNISQASNDSGYIEKCVREIIQQQGESIKEMRNYIENLERDEKSLDDKTKKRTMELDRAEKRLKSLVNVRPAFMDEYERHERELERLYMVYVEKFRNLNYLENELEVYNNLEQQKFEESQKAMERLSKKLKEEEMQMLRGAQEIDEEALDAQLERGGGERGQSRGQTRNNFNQNGGRDERSAKGQQGRGPAGRHQPVHEEEEDEEGEEGEEEEEEEEGIDVEEGSGDEEEEDEGGLNEF